MYGDKNRMGQGRNRGDAVYSCSLLGYLSTRRWMLKLVEDVRERDDEIPSMNNRSSFLGSVGYQPSLDRPWQLEHHRQRSIDRRRQIAEHSLAV